MRPIIFIKEGLIRYIGDILYQHSLGNVFLLCDLELPLMYYTGFVFFAFSKNRKDNRKDTANGKSRAGISKTLQG